MKTLISKLFAVAGVVFLIGAATSISSCKKDQTCHGHVNVYDSIAQKVAGATVRIDAYSINGDITYTAITDGQGEASFDVALPAIFDVYVFKDDIPGPISRREGKGSLNLDEPRKDNWTTITIKQ